jgi:predicted lipoprotein
MHTLSILITFMALAASTAAHADTRLNQLAVEQQIVPAYQQLSNSTAKLHSVSQDYCKAPETADPAALKHAYLDAMGDWQSIQHIRFGPVEFQLRYFRFQLWPDKRGSVGKHLNRLLASEDTAALQADAFAHDSAAIQGFSALERLIYSDTQTTPYTCLVIVAITGNLHNMATGIVTDWTQPPLKYMDIIATADQGNDFFESAEEVNATLLKNLHTELQFIVDSKLIRPLGDSIEKAQARRAESWRSGQSLNHIRQNLTATERLYRITFEPQIKDTDLQRQLDTAFKNIYTALDAVSMPLSSAVSNPKERQLVEALRKNISTVKALVAEQLTQALGIPLGFNSLDGD